MDLSRPEFSYVFLVIPILFCLAMIGQGISQMKQQRKSAPGVIILGVLFMIAVLALYFFIIR